jgi:putative ABC transport system substrate-binding protein
MRLESQMRLVLNLGKTMRRRDFIMLVGGAAVALPRATHAQQPTMPVVGFVYPGAPELSVGIVTAFRKGLGESGYTVGHNVTVEFRFAYNDNARLPELMADLVRRRATVIVTLGSTPAALAAKSATTSIPVVFSVGTDPVEVGLVAGLSHPGGNVTGITSLNSELAAKRLGLMLQLMPNVERFAVLVNPTNPNADLLTRDAQAAGSAIGRPIEIRAASTIQEIDAAFMTLGQCADALVVSPDPLLDNRRLQLVTLAAHQRLPTIYSFRENVEIGGLMSYGSSAGDRDRLAGIYVARILNGESPANLPVMRAAKFEFVFNMQTARALGLDVPASLLAQADEVIE